MTFNLWTFLFEVLNFLVLVFVLQRLLYRPLREAIDRRREEEAAARRDAEKARGDAAQMRRQLEEYEHRLEQERQEVLRQAQTEAEASRRKLLAETAEEAERRRRDAEAALERQRAEALEMLRGDLTRLAVDFAERLLHEACGASLQQQLAARFIETLEALPEAERQRVRQEWQPEDAVVIETAADLDSDMQERLSGVIAVLLGRAIQPATVIRPELLSGVRLRVGGRVWDGALASRLAEARGVAP